MTSILVDTGPTVLTKTWYVDGTATDVGTITIGIVDLDGTVIETPGTATTNNGDGTYTFSLAVQADVNELVATWTAGAQAVVDEIHIIGGRIFTEAELRAHYDADLSDATTYTDALLAEARDRDRVCVFLDGDGELLVRAGRRPELVSHVHRHGEHIEPGALVVFAQETDRAGR